MDSSKLDDATLWSRIQANDKIAYECIYNKYMPLVFSNVYKHVRSKEDAEDIVQNVFLSIWERRHSIELKGKLFSYIYASTRYTVLKYLNDKNLLAKHETAWNEWIVEFVMKDDIVSIDDAAKFHEERLQKVYNIAKELPPQMRTVYEMKMQQDMRASEIADKLGIAETTVRKHLVRIKKKLRNAAIHFFFTFLL